MITDSLRFGLIGYGAWGKCHAAAITKTAGTKLVAIAASSEKTCEDARRDYLDAAVYIDYHQLLARGDVDVVDIVLPSHLHHHAASAALLAGKHLLLEKPMCLALDQCDDLVRLARETKRVLAIGHELRLSSLWGRVKELIDEGFIGTPQYVLVELSRNPYRFGAQGWRYDIQKVGNWILEEPIHFFDLARWYLQGAGEPEKVYATGNSRQPEHPELQDNFSAIVKHKGGAYAVVSQTLSAFEHHQTVKVSGTRGALWAAWSGAMDRTPKPTFSLRAFDGEQVTTVPIVRAAGELFELEDEMAMMVAAVRDGQPVACTGEDGRCSVAICLAAQRSVDSGKEVRIV